MSAPLKLFLTLLLAPALCSAQNWKTVRLNDTTYFTAGTRQISAYFPHGPLREKDSGYLRMIFIDSFQVAGADTTFFFPRTLRETDTFFHNVCMDTLAPGWLGRKFGRQADGTEWYLNVYADTIVFKTQANLNDTWLLAKDHTGSTEFWGTVSQQGGMLIDGVTDSVKTISIQAMVNQQPVANPYNNKKFLLSKEHGWVEALELFRFPNDTLGWYQGSMPVILPVDSATHTRLPKRFNRYNRDSIDLAWKYAPGNEWIKQTSSYHNYSYPHIEVTHDSVISSGISSSGAAIVNFLTRRFTVTIISPQPNLIYDTTTATFYHTDTISSSANAYVVADHILPDYREIVAGDTDPMYYASSFCNRFLLTERSSWGVFYEPDLSTSCYQRKSFTDNQLIEKQYLEGFGQVYLQDYGGASYYLKQYYSYLKLGNCETGEKIDVIALGIDNQELTTTGISIHPNPATSQATVTSAKQLNNASLYLYDTGGRLLSQTEFSGDTKVIPTAHLSAGIYFITIRADDLKITRKLIVQK